MDTVEPTRLRRRAAYPNIVSGMDAKFKVSGYFSFAEQPK
jgi:hypothetical protein